MHHFSAIRTLLMVGTAAAAAVALGACGDDEENTTDATGATATTGSTSSSTAASGTGGAGGGGTGGETAQGGGGTGGDGGAGGGTGGSGGAGTCVAQGESCATGDTCCDAAGATGICHPFMMGNDPRCTITCPADPMDCPLTDACNMMGVCRIQ
ncbi:MAG: hypothetical protein AAF928_00610 [Myxococcota bacterium]